MKNGQKCPQDVYRDYFAPQNSSLAGHQKKRKNFVCELNDSSNLASFLFVQADSVEAMCLSLSDPDGTFFTLRFPILRGKGTKAEAAPENESVKKDNQQVTDKIVTDMKLP